jgi:predicted DNA-binding protein YlxM (UPF0122 family)
MGRKRKINVKAVPARDNDTLARDMKMFEDHYVHGLTYDELAAKYEITRDGVYYTAKVYNWKGLMKEANERQFAQMLHSLDRFAFRATNLLNRDLERLIEKFNKNEALTSEERTHVRAMIDRILKERRLEQGKPTEISTGPAEINIRLPKGVKHFGVIPTVGRSVKMIETDESEPDEEKRTLDLDLVDFNSSKSNEEPDDEI